MIEAPHIEYDRLCARLRENPGENAGTPERRKLIVAHRLLTDLIAAGGGTPEQRAEVMRRLNAGTAGEG